MLREGYHKLLRDNPVDNWFDNPPISRSPDPAAVPTYGITPSPIPYPAMDTGQMYVPPGVTEWPDGPGVWPPL